MDFRWTHSSNNMEVGESRAYLGVAGYIPKTETMQVVVVRDDGREVWVRSFRLLNKMLRNLNFEQEL